MSARSCFQLTARKLLSSQRIGRRSSGTSYAPLGGHIEVDEEAVDAAVREFQEETGVNTDASEWTEFAVCDGPGWKMHCFVAFSDSVRDCRTLTDESVTVECVVEVLQHVARHPDKAPPDLIALMGLALQAGVRKGCACLSYD